MNNYLGEVLASVKNGELTPEEAAIKIKAEPFDNLGFARVDTQRKIRNGVSEVIYGEGKSAEQINEIVKRLAQSGEERVLITRLSEDKARLIDDIEYFKTARIGIYGKKKAPDGIGTIVVATGGTSDIPVAEEAAVTAEFLGNSVIRLYDVGVAGLHRLLSELDSIMGASVIIAVAGMEGALASVVGGLSDCPVIAVPTSVGYGAAFDGLAALLSMLNSCASGVSVVNIDNGFGAGYTASMINHMEGKK